MTPSYAELTAPETPAEIERALQVLKMAMAVRARKFLRPLGPAIVRKYKRPGKRWLESVKRELVVADRQGENAFLDILELVIREYEVPFDAMAEAAYAKLRAEPEQFGPPDFKIYRRWPKYEKIAYLDRVAKQRAEFAAEEQHDPRA